MWLGVEFEIWGVGMDVGCMKMLGGWELFFVFWWGVELNVFVFLGFCCWLFYLEIVLSFVVVWLGFVIWCFVFFVFLCFLIILLSCILFVLV